MTKKLPQRTFLDISTAHITQNDSELLTELAHSDDSNLPLTIIDQNYGHIVVVHKDVVKQGLQSIRNKGFSDSFIKLVVYVTKSKHNGIWLDQDGDTVDEFEEHEW